MDEGTGSDAQITQGTFSLTDLIYQDMAILSRHCARIEAARIWKGDVSRDEFTEFYKTFRALFILSRTLLDPGRAEAISSWLDHVTNERLDKARGVALAESMIDDILQQLDDPAAPPFMLWPEEV